MGGGGRQRNTPLPVTEMETTQEEETQALGAGGGAASDRVLHSEHLPPPPH